jgi:hypothetical protein
MQPEHRSIGELAYRIWQDRGCPEGSAEQDWLDAEKQLLFGTAAADAVDKSLQATFPASDPPASHLKDEPPANAAAKWDAARAAKSMPRKAPDKLSVKPVG